MIAKCHKATACNKEPVKNLNSQKVLLSEKSFPISPTFFQTLFLS